MPSNLLEASRAWLVPSEIDNGRLALELAQVRRTGRLSSAGRVHLPQSNHLPLQAPAARGLASPTSAFPMSWLVSWEFSHVCLTPFNQPLQ